MCGRYTLEMEARRIELLYELEEPLESLLPRYNVAPGQTVAVVGLKPDGKRRGLAMLHWGFISRWANGPKDGPRPINAKAETLREKTLFRDAFAKRRCILPASGFFEWKTAGKKKQGHYIRLRGDELMSVAGLWEVWGHGPERLATCCIITVPANEVIAAYHERMPAILPPSSIAAWIDRETPLDLAHSLLQTFPGAAMEAYPVGPAVNSVKNDTPECIRPAA